MVAPDLKQVAPVVAPESILTPSTASQPNAASAIGLDRSARFLGDAVVFFFGSGLGRLDGHQRDAVGDRALRPVDVVVPRPPLKKPRGPSNILCRQALMRFQPGHFDLTQLRLGPPE